MNKLITRVNDPLKYMITLSSESFDLIYLEPPFKTGLVEWGYEEKDWKETNDIQYGEYISHLVECAHNLLRKKGFLCFLINSNMNTYYNYQMILEHFFQNIAQISLMDKRRSPWGKGLDPHSIIYCCCNDSAFIYPDYKEMDTSTNYPEIDEKGRRFRKVPTWKNLSKERCGMIYTWHGIKLMGRETWAYNRETLDQEYEKGNIIIEHNRVYRKRYQEEVLVSVGTVWENDNTSSIISEKNILRILNIFSVEGQKVLCPFERDGMFSFFSDTNNREWTSIYVPTYRRKNYLEKIPENHYQTIAFEGYTKEIDYEEVTKSSSEIDELRAKLKQLQEAVRSIQEEIGVFEEDKVELAVDRIHEKIIEMITGQNISAYIPEAQNWVVPYWEKLENESKQFLPTGAFLFKQFEKQMGADYAPAMIEYCRTLEKEMFEKLFYGYIKNLIDRKIDIRGTFPDSFLTRNHMYLPNS